MDPKLQAGIELTLEKAAAEEAGVGLLASSLQQKLAERMQKRAEDQVLEQTSSGKAGPPSSASGRGMEDKNKNYGKSADGELEDDPSKGEDTGKVVTSVGGANITTEASGMPDLTKSAADISGLDRIPEGGLRVSGKGSQGGKLMAPPSSREDVAEYAKKQKAKQLNPKQGSDIRATLASMIRAQL